MSKRATKAADNVFYLARMDAVKLNNEFSSREGASNIVDIDSRRLADIELSNVDPYPEEIIRLAEGYNAPELNNYFCSSICPLGCQSIPKLDIEELDRLIIKILASLKSTEDITDGLVEIGADGKISHEEQPKLDEIIGKLDNIINNANSLKLWV